MRSAAAMLALVLVAGCQLAPPHVRPAAPVPEQFPAIYGGDSVAGQPVPTIGWRDFFRDPRLDALIASALEHNRDLAIAIGRIEEARGLYRIQRADQLPTVGASASATRNRTGGAAVAGAPASAGGVTYDRYSIGVGTSFFELDFWGRVRNLSEAARSQFLATVQAQRAARLSLIRAVAATYLGSREAAERIRLAEATVESRREGLRIAQVRFEAGITSELDFRQAESLLTQAETELAGLHLSLARSGNALAVLVGGPVDSVLAAPLPLTEQTSAAPLTAGLPSALLTSRPDIIAAEEQLRAARANIGAARAALFPTISLTGTLGFASTELSKLVGENGLTWSFGPSIDIPIFDAGRRRGNVAVQEAREQMAIAGYEQAVQIAFQEVADALAGRRYLAEQVASQERGVAAQRQIATLARTRYNEGVVAYIEVLDAERNLFIAEQSLLQLRRAEAENLVGLYVALGGGSIE